MKNDILEQWFLIQFKPNSHKIANRNLQIQGFETFLPLFEITKRKQQSFLTDLKPLFPGYMFVKFNPNLPQWRAIKGTFGVSRVVSFGNKLSVVPMELIKGLMQRCDKNGRFIIPKDFNIGNKVEVIKGPFTNFIATVDKIESTERISILLNYLGQNTIVSVNKGNIKNVISKT